MARGPKGEKRPVDVIGAAIMVGRIATGEIDETATTEDGKNAAAVALGPFLLTRELAPCAGADRSESVPGNGWRHILAG
jgi:hypothetical protein